MIVRFLSRRSRNLPGRSLFVAIAAAQLVGTATAGPPLCDCECNADIDGDGQVSPSDLALLLAAWGQYSCADMDFNGEVDAADLAILLGAWGPCPTPSSLVPNLVIDLDVDSNRDGTVTQDGADDDGEDQWTNLKGALFMVNCDDDNGDGKIDGLRWSKDETPSDEDLKINGEEDFKDLVEVVIRNPKVWKPTWTAHLKIAAAEQLRAIHLFPQIKDGATSIWGGPAENLTVLEKDITDLVKKTACGTGDLVLGLEGLTFRLVDAVSAFPATHTMLFSGFVDLTLEIRDTAAPGTPVGTPDKVRLKVAPVLLLPNTNDALEVYAQDQGTENEAFRDDIKSVVGGKLKIYKSLPVTSFATTYLGAPVVAKCLTDTQWAQDDVEIGYAQTPRGLMHVALYTRHHGSVDDFNITGVKKITPATAPVWYLAKGIGDAKWRLENLLKKDRGLYRNPGPADSSVTSSDYGGNIELLQPQDVAGKKLGLICYGGGPIKKISAKKQQFFISQEVQTPLPVDDIATDWLAVGHVDEIVAFWTPKVGDTGKAKVIIAAPKDSAYAIITGPAADRRGDPNEDPGTFFAKGPHVWGFASSVNLITKQLTTPLLVDELTEYKYLRIYDGDGRGVVARIVDIENNGFESTITIDKSWGPYDPAEPEMLDYLDQASEVRTAGFAGFYYAREVNASGWLAGENGLFPGAGSKFILVPDTDHWASAPAPGFQGIPDPETQENPAVFTIKEVRDNFPKMKALNEKLQTLINTTMGKIETAFGGAANVEFIKVPVVFTFPKGNDPAAPKNCFAWTPGAANILFAEGKLLIAKQRDFKDGKTKFGEAITTAISPGDATVVKFVDDFETYHLKMGEVHCGTNVLRKPFDFKWWEKLP